MWNKQLEKIEMVLPCTYNGEDIIKLLKEYYPHEWSYVEQKKKYYDKKDKFLQRRFGKARYRMPAAEKLIRRNRTYRRLLSERFMKKHSSSFDEKIWQENKGSLWKKRQPKIDKVNEKIANVQARTQMVTPKFLDKLIGFYERKNASQKDRMYILQELKKYYNDAIISFFFKLNDTELNMQLRHEAFYHLQSFNYTPRLRKQKYMLVHTKNKKRKKYLKKEYAKETYTIPHTPDELEYRIQNGKEQKIKSYDYFISHSSKDSRMVRRIIAHENSLGKNIFCDWINDADYLKRHLLCDATLEVIEWRLQQSDAIIFLRTPHSLESVWCKYELNYFAELKKPIYYLDGEMVQNGDFSLQKYDSGEYLDPEYKQKCNLMGQKLDMEGKE